jgi:hypothetical protein
VTFFQRDLPAVAIGICLFWLWHCFTPVGVAPRASGRAAILSLCYPEGRLNTRDQPRFIMARNMLIRDYCLPPSSWPSKKTNKQKKLCRDGGYATLVKSGCQSLNLLRFADVCTGRQAVRRARIWIEATSQYRER